MAEQEIEIKVSKLLESADRQKDIYNILGALEHCDDALKIDPNSWKAWAKKAEIKFHGGLADSNQTMIEQAVQCYYKMLELIPETNEFRAEHAKYWNNISEAYRFLGDANLQIGCLEEAHRINPEGGYKVALDMLRASQAIYATQQKSLAVTKKLREKASDYKKKHEFHRSSLIGQLLALGILYVGGISFIGYMAFQGVIPLTEIQVSISYADNPLAFLPWLVMLALVSWPLIWAIRLTIKSADKAEIMEQSFWRQDFVEQYIVTLRDTKINERVRKIETDYLYHWMNNSPAETLERLSGKGGDPKGHMLEEFLSRIVALLKK